MRGTACKHNRAEAADAQDEETLDLILTVPAAEHMCCKELHDLGLLLGKESAERKPKQDDLALRSNIHKNAL